MTAFLAKMVSDSYQNPKNKNLFFSKSENIDLYNIYIEKEKPNNPLAPCDTNLFIGMFFDGTCNNYADSINNKDNSQSNVARLYSAFPGISVPGVLPASTEWQTNREDYTNYFRIYAPGVGSTFTQVGDSGEGIDGTMGGAAGLWGQVRILWGLAQVINAVNRFFTKQMLIDNNEVQEASKRGVMSLGALKADPLTRTGWQDPINTGRDRNEKRDLILPKTLKNWLQKLHKAIDPHMIKPGAKRPTNIDPGIVRTIYLSTFGFSRGSAEARVFSNWLVKLCQLDARLTGHESNGLTLAGFPLTFDFLGIFDTVASVGVANLVPVSDGHAAWSDAEVSLAIPSEVAHCVHLVAAHENRRAFPLDSIYNDHSFPSNGEEIVFPGVHSDLGGGYKPCEQGKGTDNVGWDMISRIPLAVMYKKARLSGVPFKLEQALPQDQVAYDISPQTINDFNAYIDLCQIKSGDTATIVREHWQRTIEWRLNNHRAGGVYKLTSYNRASDYDRNNLASSYTQFCEELEQFNQWRKSYHRAFDGGEHWDEYSPPMFVLADWKRIDSFLPQLGESPKAVSVLMDEYIHDSIAGFLIKWGSREEVVAALTELLDKKHLIDAAGNDYFKQQHLRDEHIWLTPKERDYATYYEKTGKIPPMHNLGGREPAALGAGYLRFRRIYAGGDDQILADLMRTPSEQPLYATSENQPTHAAG